MGSLSLDDINGASEPLRQYNFDFIIPNVPGGGDGNALRIKLMTATLPGFSHDVFESAHQGNIEPRVGRKQFTRELPLTFEEDENMTVYTALWNWSQLQGDARTNVQAKESDYKVRSYLEVFRSDRSLSRRIVLHRSFIKNVADTQLDGNTPDKTVISAVLGFSYWDWDI